MPITKTQRLTVRFSPGEQQKLELAAFASGVTPSEFIRRVSMTYAQTVIESLDDQLAQLEETNHA